MNLRFSKMHGLGNDFVVVDCRRAPLPIDAAMIRATGDRHFGIGFDQLLTIEPARDRSCAFAYGIWNTDGSRSGQCGNGLRCVARWLARAGAIGPGRTRLESPSGPVTVEVLENGHVRADMGEPAFDAQAIGLRADAAAIDAARALWQIDLGSRAITIGAVSMGNPHALLVVEDITRADVALLGPQIEHAEAFVEGCNAGFAQILSRKSIKLRVWERGVGETLACGSGACAAVALLRQRDALDADVQVALPGGTLAIHWQGVGHSLAMSGPATFVFEGEWPLDVGSVMTSMAINSEPQEARQR